MAGWYYKKSHYFSHTGTGCFSKFFFYLKVNDICYGTTMELAEFERKKLKLSGSLY